MIQLVNDYRIENGLSSIKINLEMNDFAKNFILKLLDENALYHSELNNWTYSVENLYTEYGFGSIIGLNEEWYNQIAQQTIDSWKKISFPVEDSAFQCTHFRLLGNSAAILACIPVPEYHRRA